MESPSIVLGAMILLALAAFALYRGVSPGWTARGRALIADEAVDAFWEEGVRLVWENWAVNQSPTDPGYLDVSVAIPLPAIGPTTYVRFCYRGG